MEKLTLAEMENLNGGMPCWAAKLSLIAAGIAVMGSGGLLFAVAVAGFTFAEWGYLESCSPQLLD